MPIRLSSMTPLPFLLFVALLCYAGAANSASVRVNFQQTDPVENVCLLGIPHPSLTSLALLPTQTKLGDAGAVPIVKRDGPVPLQADQVLPQLAGECGVVSGEASASELYCWKRSSGGVPVPIKNLTELNAPDQDAGRTLILTISGDAFQAPKAFDGRQIELAEDLPQEVNMPRAKTSPRSSLGITFSGGSYSNRSDLILRQHGPDRVGAVTLVPVCTVSELTLEVPEELYPENICLSARSKYAQRREPPTDVDVRTISTRMKEKCALADIPLVPQRTLKCWTSPKATGAGPPNKPISVAPSALSGRTLVLDVPSQGGTHNRPAPDLVKAFSRNHIRLSVPQGELRVVGGSYLNNHRLHRRSEGDGYRAELSLEPACWPRKLRIPANQQPKTLRYSFQESSVTRDLQGRGKKRCDASSGLAVEVPANARRVLVYEGKSCAGAPWFEASWAGSQPPTELKLAYRALRLSGRKPWDLDACPELCVGKCESVERTPSATARCQYLLHFDSPVSLPLSVSFKGQRSCGYQKVLDETQDLNEDEIVVEKRERLTETVTWRSQLYDDGSQLANINLSPPEGQRRICATTKPLRRSCDRYQDKIRAVELSLPSGKAHNISLPPCKFSNRPQEYWVPGVHLGERSTVGYRYFGGRGYADQSQDLVGFKLELERPIPERLVGFGVAAGAHVLRPQDAEFTPQIAGEIIVAIDLPWDAKPEVRLGFATSHRELFESQDASSPAATAFSGQYTSATAYLGMGAKEERFYFALAGGIVVPVMTPDGARVPNLLDRTDKDPPWFSPSGRFIFAVVLSEFAFLEVDTRFTYPEYFRVADFRTYRGAPSITDEPRWSLAGGLLLRVNDPI